MSLLRSFTAKLAPFDKSGENVRFMTDWFVYIVRCSDGSLYTGISNNVSKRIDRHNAGKGAKYTNARRPVKLVRTESFVSENEARKRESQIKGWIKVNKENLVKFGHPDGPQ